MNPLMLRAAVLFVIAFALAGAGWYAAAKFYRGEVVEAQAESARLQTLNDQMSASLRRQNDAVDRIRADSEARAKRAAAALAQAKAHSAPLKLRAQEVLALRMPAGTSECAAAQQLIAQELAQR